MLQGGIHLHLSGVHCEVSTLQGDLLFSSKEHHRFDVSNSAAIKKQYFSPAPFLHFSYHYNVLALLKQSQAGAYPAR